MTIAIQQVKIGSGSTGTAVSCTVTSTLSGSTMVACVCHTAAFMSLASVTGPAGFSPIHEDFIANYAQTDFYFKDNESSGVTSYSASGGNNIQKALIMWELTSALTTGSSDVHNSGNGNSTAPTVTGGTLAQASEAVLSAIVASQNAAITADGSATSSVESHSVNGAFLGQGKIVNSTAGPTLGGTSTSVKWLDSMATFKDAAGGGGGGGGTTGVKHPTIPGIASVT